jgi:hypothetical protein
MIASSIATTAIPAPIPAFAPVPRPLLAVSDEPEGAAAGEEAAFFGVLAVGEALTSGDMLAVLVALDATGIEADDGNATPTVAANVKTLELIPQQFLSPQHQVPCPHFRTGAFSSCHCTPYFSLIPYPLPQFNYSL